VPPSPCLFVLPWRNDGPLGTRSGGSRRESEAIAINNHGQIVGRSDSAFSYSGGVMTAIPGTYRASDINDSGQVVGGGQLFSNGQVTNLDAIGCNACGAYAINNHTQIVGVSGDKAFVFSDGVTMDLGARKGWERSRANAINDNGQNVISAYVDPGYWRVFLLSGGVMTGLGTLGGTESWAYDINDLGQIVGCSQTESGEWHVFLYNPDTLPFLSVSPTSLSPGCLWGQTAASQSFCVRNTGGGILGYTISTNAAWLSVSPTSGWSTGEQETITIDYATSGLLSGQYSAIITVSAPEVANSPKTIEVSLTVEKPAVSIKAVDPIASEPGRDRGNRAEFDPQSGLQYEGRGHYP
jgi:probable HAF family extracellular repeat protein